MADRNHARTRMGVDSESDTTWMQQAACTGAPVSVLFPASVEDQRRTIVYYCDHCPVRARCLEYSLTQRIYDGIWGGMVETDRRRILGDRNKAAAGG